MSIDSIVALMSESENLGVLKEYTIASIQLDPNQPRKYINENTLFELAETIKEHGVLQPIVIRPVDDIYMIVAGERRWKAAKLAGLTTIPAILRDVKGNKLTSLQLIENLQRDNMLPLEEAQAIVTMMHDFNMTGSDVAKAIGKKPAYVSLRKKLLSLPKSIKAIAEKGVIKDAETLTVLSDLWKLDKKRANFFITNPDRITRSLLRKEIKQVKSQVDVKQASEESTGSQGKQKSHHLTLSESIATRDINFSVELINLVSNDVQRGFLVTDKVTPYGHIWIETEKGDHKLYHCSEYSIILKGACQR